MIPKSLRNTHPHYCKGAPTETLPVNKQKSKLWLKSGRETEKRNRGRDEQIQYSEAIEVKTKSKPFVMKEPTPQPRQLTARELIEASYNEIRRAKREEQMQKKKTVLNQKC